MRNKQQDLDPIKTYRRKQTAARRVGKNDRCACGEVRTEALVGNTGVCAACKRRTNGHVVTDKHHVAGSANSPLTVPIFVNDHRAILSMAQYDWPKETLENPHGDPLRAAAACIREFIDTICHLCKDVLKWTAEMLELLSDYLIERNGPDWWMGTPLKRFATKGRR